MCLLSITSVLHQEIEDFTLIINQAWWRIPTFSILKKPMQEDGQKFDACLGYPVSSFKASLNYIVRPCLKKTKANHSYKFGERIGFIVFTNMKFS